MLGYFLRLISRLISLEITSVYLKTLKHRRGGNLRYRHRIVVMPAQTVGPYVERLHGTHFSRRQ